jgi:hypothetical protein
VGPLVLAGALKALSSVGGAVFRGIGRPDLSLVIQAVIVVGTFSCMAWSVSRGGGLTGVALAVLAGALLVTPVQLWLIRRVLDLSLRLQLRALAPALTLSLLCPLPALLARTVADLQPPVMIAVAGGGAAMVFVAVAFVQHRLWNVGPVSLGLTALRERREGGGVRPDPITTAVDDPPEGRPQA